MSGGRLTTPFPPGKEEALLWELRGCDLEKKQYFPLPYTSQEVKYQLRGQEPD